MNIPPDAIKQKLKHLGVRPDKYLGQHFLVDSSVLDRIIAESKQFLHPDDTIVEVGPGLGVLTDQLATFDTPVIAVEKDPVFARALQEEYKEKSVSVIQGDILRELEQASSQLHQELNKKPWVVIANIPYAITSPLLRLLFSRENPPHDVFVLVQKELAERISALPGNSARGLLTVLLELVAASQIVQEVPSQSFWPEPKVMSALLHLKSKPQEKIDESFLRVVSAGFSQKRKKLHNSLTSSLALPNQQVKDWLYSVGIDPDRRAETLTLEEWKKLTLVLPS